VPALTLAAHNPLRSADDLAVHTLLQSSIRLNAQACAMRYEHYYFTLQAGVAAEVRQRFPEIRFFPAP
jgi:hypothetical protein